MPLLKLGRLVHTRLVFGGSIAMPKCVSCWWRCRPWVTACQQARQAAIKPHVLQTRILCSTCLRTAEQHPPHIVSSSCCLQRLRASILPFSCMKLWRMLESRLFSLFRATVPALTLWRSLLLENTNDYVAVSLKHFDYLKRTISHIRERHRVQNSDTHCVTMTRQQP